jgi:hypothetical protein
MSRVLLQPFFQTILRWIVSFGVTEALLSVVVPHVFASAGWNADAPDEQDGLPGIRHVCAGTGPRLRRDWTTSAPRLTRPRLRRD